VPPKAEDFNAKTPSKAEGAKPPRLPFFLCALALSQGHGKTASFLNEEIRKAGKESFRSCFPAFLIQISAGSDLSAAGGDPACPCRRDVGRVSDSASSRVSKPWKNGRKIFQSLENVKGSTSRRRS
jgi:hypothetical protein